MEKKSLSVKGLKKYHFNSTLCLRKIVNDHSNCTMTGSFFSFRNPLSRVKNLDESFSHTIRVSISFQMSSTRIEINTGSSFGEEIIL